MKDVSRAWVVAAAVFVLAILPMQNASSGTHKVRFCFNDWPPYAALVDETPTGISVDILKEASRRAGLEADFIELPWNRCLKMVSDGAIDAVMDASLRPNFLQGPTSVTQYSNTFWVRDDDEAERFEPAVLRHRKLGLVDGYNYPPSLTELIGKAVVEVEYSVDDATNIRKLAFGRVDLIVGDIVGTAVFARAHRLKIRALKPSHSSDPLYASFNSERGAMQRAINAALAEMLAGGEVDRIYREHIGMAFTEISDQIRAAKR